MEKLANLTQNDINNGVFNRMLVNAGIPDVQEYVKNFHQETEELLIKEFEHSDKNNTHKDEQIVPPTDIHSWITSLRPRFDDSIQPSLPEEQPQLPVDVQGWINGLRPCLDDPIQPSVPKQQEPQKQQPTDLQSWMKGMIPSDIHSSTENTTSEITATSNDNSAVTGNLGTWLTDWSKNLYEQPPPKSLDVRLNSYLNAAQKVLSEHGYNVSNEIKPSNNIPTKVGMFGNVKQMYFLWKILDKNNDRKITVEDVQIMFEEMGLGFLSKYVGQTLFDMIDTNHDGTLQFRDFVALMSIIKQLMSALTSAKTKA